MISNFIGKIRQVTPLWLRKKIGPFFAYISYFLYLHIKTKNKPKVLSLDETLDLIIKENLSCIRFGDGELSLIEGTDLSFQESNDELKKYLTKIIKYENDKLLICILDIWGDLSNFSKRSFWFTLHHLFRYRENWLNLLNINRIYGNAFITRPYLNYKNKNNASSIFVKIRSIWDKKDALLIEGSKSRLGVGNDLFSNSKSLKRLLCPAENAFSVYEKIIKTVVDNTDKETLILLSLGPTAKVVSFELFNLGYRVIDIGHIDMEYEMFLKNTESITKIPYKYFNEINERNPEDCNDPLYKSQIIAEIS